MDAVAAVHRHRPLLLQLMRIPPLSLPLLSLVSFHGCCCCHPPPPSAIAVADENPWMLLLRHRPLLLQLMRIPPPYLGKKIIGNQLIAIHAIIYIDMVLNIAILIVRVLNIAILIGGGSWYCNILPIFVYFNILPIYRYCNILPIYCQYIANILHRYVP